MTEQPLFSLADNGAPDLERTGGLDVAADGAFATARRIQLDATSWVDHVQGWLSGDTELMAALMEQASWEQRSRWMYTRVVDEPRLTAEYPSIDDRTLPVLRHTAEVLGEHYGLTYQRLWMNWYRDHNDGTGWHADRPANQFPETTIPVLSLGATRKFLVRHKDGGRSTPFVVAGGDLLVMGGRCQREWMHMVPKQKGAAGPRLSLNFSTAQVEERRQRSA
jgi:alkylated DNA repair dioxygenase AlkB